MKTWTRWMYVITGLAVAFVAVSSVAAGSNATRDQPPSAT